MKQYFLILTATISLCSYADILLKDTKLQRFVILWTENDQIKAKVCHGVNDESLRESAGTEVPVEQKGFWTLFSQAFPPYKPEGLIKAAKEIEQIDLTLSKRVLNETALKTDRASADRLLKRAVERDRLKSALADTHILELSEEDPSFAAMNDCWQSKTVVKPGTDAVNVISQARPSAKDDYTIQKFSDYAYLVLPKGVDRRDWTHYSHQFKTKAEAERWVEQQHPGVLNVHSPEGLEWEIYPEGSEPLSFKNQISAVYYLQALAEQNRRVRKVRGAGISLFPAKSLVGSQAARLKLESQIYEVRTFDNGQAELVLRPKTNDPTYAERLRLRFNSEVEARGYLANSVRGVVQALDDKMIETRWEVYPEKSGYGGRFTFKTKAEAVQYMQNNVNSRFRDYQYATHGFYPKDIGIDSL